MDALYQINTRVWLTERSRALGRPATLDDVTDHELDRVAGMGFDWVWLLSVWGTGPAGQRVSRESREFLQRSAGRARAAGRSRRPVAAARVRAGVGRQLDVGWLHRVVLGDPGGQRRLIAVNYAGNQGQCYVRLPFSDIAAHAVRFRDLMSPASYERDGSDLLSRGLYLDLPAWSYHVFDVSPA